MPTLINQLCEAIRAWVRQTGEAEQNVLLWPIVNTGAAWFLEPVDESPGVRGHHTVEQLRDWLEVLLVERIHINEAFLVSAVVRDIDSTFERLSEDYAKGIQARRAEKEQLERIYADEDARQNFVRQMNERRRIPVRGLPNPETEFTEADLLGLIDHFSRFATPSLVDQRRNRIMLDVWRDVTAPILDEENLRKAKGEEYSRYIRQEE